MAAELVVVKGNHRGEYVQLHHVALTIGRSRSAHLCLEQDTKVSGEHAKIVPLGGSRYVLEDLGSTNGTFVNEERIDQCPLRSGDLIKIGRSLLIFRADGGSVHLADIDTKGGGSSANLRPASGGSSANLRPGSGAHLRPGSSANLRPSASAEGPETDESTPLPQLDERAPALGVEQQMLQELALATGEPDLRVGLERGLGALLVGTGAARALLFLRHPITGGLGCAAIKTQEGAQREAPVDPELLTRASLGEVVSDPGAAAAPLTVQGQPMGAVYLDGDQPEAHPGLRLRILTAAGLQLGLMIAADRSARLAASATEIVGLAQAQVTKRSVDLSALLAGTDRLYGPVAGRRRLSWSVEAAAGLTVHADPLLLGRGLDTLVEHLMGAARGWLRIQAHEGEGQVTVRLIRPLIEAPEAVPTLLDAEGVAADLRRASQRLDDGALAVARVSLLRAGAALEVALDDQHVVYTVGLPTAPAGGGV